jgi:hypothetical protein
MDRTTVYRDQLPYETDILGLQRQAYQGFGLLALDLFGSATSVARFPCGPTAPTSMAVMVGPGTIYVLKNLDDAPWGDRDAVGGLAADTDADHKILKQGIFADTVVFATPAPVTVGHSVKYLIEADFTEDDAPDETTQFYNVANPGVGFTDDVSRTRRNLANLYLITGTSGASPSIPPTTAGRVPIWVITVAHTDTTVTAGNIAAHPSAPFVDVGGGGGGGTPLTPWAVVASNHTAVAGERLILDATGGTFTLTLPATPVAGNEGIRIKGNFLTTNVTVARNGHTIAGSATNLTLDKDYVDIELVYDGTTWRV